MRTREHRKRSQLPATIGWTVLAGSLFQAVCQERRDYPCGHSTVDDNYGRVYSSEARSFLSKLQHVVKADDRAQFAVLVQYPLRINGDHKLQIPTPEDLIRKYPQIVTPNVKLAITHQSANCLFANGDGVMIGDGQVWFNEDASGKMKIVTINLGLPNRATSH